MTDVLWITSTYPWSEDPVAGVFFRTQAGALARLGLAVTVLSPTPWAPWPMSLLRTKWRRYARAPRTETDDRVVVARPRYLNVPGQPSWALPDRSIAQAVWRARREWAGARLVHGHYAITGLAAWHVARRAGLPYVLTFHGHDMNHWPDEHPDRLADLKLAVRQAGAVITVSGALADRVRTVLGVEAVHLPLGCDHRALAASAMPRSEARRLLDLPEHAVVVLMVGYLMPHKGVRALVDAILALGDPFLGVIVGEGTEFGYGSSDSRAAGHLQYAGQAPHERVAIYMSAADVLVLPSSTEGLPTVLVEAGSLGLPVIASSVGGIPELLGDDRGTLLSDVSAEAVASALAAFHAHRAEAEAAARRLRDHVLAAYDVDRNAARLLECYRSVAPGLDGP